MNAIKRRGLGKMTLETDEVAEVEQQLRDQDRKRVSRSLWKRAKDVRRQYEKMLTRLWVANAGGAVVTMTYIGTESKAGHLSRGPLYWFLVGLLFLGFGAFYDLVKAWNTIRANQSATGLLDLTT